MQVYYMDLHIHLGRTLKNAPVKITASNRMNVDSVIEEAIFHKGMDVIGLIDCLSPLVLNELEDYIQQGRAIELQEGGLLVDGKLTIILGAEIEVYDQNCKGPIHVLCYFPSLKSMRSFSNWCRMYIKNITLSTQRIYISAKILQQRVKDGGGWFIPAHVFTPFKSVYGKGVDTYMEEVFEIKQIDAVELGLSSDTHMARTLPELDPFPFLTNSDAHSVKMIAREHQVILCKEPSFIELGKVLQTKNERKILKNVGLSPKLVKYYQTVCDFCIGSENKCDDHERNSVVKGVSDRVQELSSKQNGKNMINIHRPTYLHQAPLEMIPSVGPKTIQDLISRFGSEMKVLHEVPSSKLKEVVSNSAVEKIDLMRKGKLHIRPGGGGVKGKIL
nr:endonuclease Q family protein [Salipaludibacillus daqingensis]